MTVDDAMSLLYDPDQELSDREILLALFRAGYDAGYAERDAIAKAKRKAGKASGNATRARAHEQHVRELQARYDQGLKDGYTAARPGMR